MSVLAFHWRRRGNLLTWTDGFAEYSRTVPKGKVEKRPRRTRTIPHRADGLAGRNVRFPGEERRVVCPHPSFPGGLWEVRGDEEPLRFLEFGSHPALSPDGRHLAFLHGTDLRVRDQKTGRVFSVFEQKKEGKRGKRAADQWRTEFKPDWKRVESLLGSNRFELADVYWEKLDAPPPERYFAVMGLMRLGIGDAKTLTRFEQMVGDREFCIMPTPDNVEEPSDPMEWLEGNGFSLDFPEWEAYADIAARSEFFWRPAVAWLARNRRDPDLLEEVFETAGQDLRAVYPVVLDALVESGRAPVTELIRLYEDDALLTELSRDKWGRRRKIEPFREEVARLLSGHDSPMLGKKRWKWIREGRDGYDRFLRVEYRRDPDRVLKIMRDRIEEAQFARFMFLGEFSDAKSFRLLREILERFDDPMIRGIYLLEALRMRTDDRAADELDRWAGEADEKEEKDRLRLWGKLIRWGNRIRKGDSGAWRSYTRYLETFRYGLDQPYPDTRPLQWRMKRRDRKALRWVVQVLENEVLIPRRVRPFERLARTYLEHFGYRMVPYFQGFTIIPR